MNPKLTAALVLVAVAAALGYGGYIWQQGKRSGSAPASVPLAAPPTGGDFTLDSAQGPVALKDLRGKVVLMYFGYASCPDVCPTALATAAQAVAALDPSELAQVRMLFVSVDPERDTPEKLKDYAAYFHPSLTGVTGTAEQLDEVVARYGASYKKGEKKEDGSYAVDHSSFTYVIGQNGKLAASLPHGTAAKDVLAEVRKLLAEQRPAPPPPPAPAGAS
jgi:protein SCO1/2